MDSQHWLESLRSELARRRLPEAYADRLLQELADHFEDLKEETMSTESVTERLGDPSRVAEAAVQCRPGFFRRHRWLRMTTFVLLPVPMLILSWVLLICLMDLAGDLWLAGEPIVAPGHQLSWLQFQLVHLLFSATIFLPAMLIAGGYYLLAKRTRSRLRWGIVAGLLVAGFAGLVSHQIAFSDIPGQNTLTIGIGFPPGWSVWQALQFGLPGAVICLLIWKPRRVVSWRMAGN